MPNTYTNLLFHIVCSTKYRRPLIKSPWQDELYGYIGGIIRNNRGTLLTAGGMQDHVHLLAPGQRCFHLVHDLTPLPTSQQRRSDRGATGRELVDHGDVEISVGRERKAARNRRRRHDEGVGRGAFRRLLDERLTLEHTKAMLLVDDDDCQAVEGDLPLHERMGADDEIDLSRSECGAQGLGIRLRNGGGEERGAHFGSARQQDPKRPRIIRTVHGVGYRCDG